MFPHLRLHLRSLPVKISAQRESSISFRNGYPSLVCQYHRSKSRETRDAGSSNVKLQISYRNSRLSVQDQHSERGEREREREELVIRNEATRELHIQSLLFEARVYERKPVIS